MAITLYTVQIAQWRLCEELNIPLLDTTFRSGIPAFAPDHSWVYQIKNRIITEEEYTSLYTVKMRLSFRHHYDRWEELKRYDVVAIACYCPPGKFCHRHLFLDMVVKYLRLNGIEVILGGEITKDNYQSIPRVPSHAADIGTASATPNTARQFSDTLLSPREK